MKKLTKTQTVGNWLLIIGFGWVTATTLSTYISDIGSGAEANLGNLIIALLATIIVIMALTRLVKSATIKQPS